MNVRNFEQGDVAPANRLTNHFIEETAVHFGTAPASDAEFAAVWQAGVNGTPAYPWLAAEVDGSFAGYAKAGVWRTRAAYALTAEVTVYVEPTFHRCGVGRGLYAELLARLTVAGFHTAVGGITLPNPGSVKLHEAMGFVYVGTFREVGRKFDAWHDTGWWQKVLGGGVTSDE